MTGTTNGKSSKKPYVKPTVTEVKLASDEAALAGCKGAPHVSGPNSTNKCNFAIWPCQQASPS